MFPRTLLKYRVRDGVIQPLFLDPNEGEHVAAVERAVAFYEANLAKRRGGIDFDELRYELSDDRLADGLRHALGRVYTYAAKMPEVPVRSSPMSLRLKLFKLVGSSRPGFAEDRLDALRAFVKEGGEELRGVTVEELDGYLWSDDPRGYVLTRMRERVSPRDAIRYYNFEVLDTILSNSRMVSFETRGSREMPRGTFAKKLVREVKRLGLIYEARLLGDRVSVDVYGPVELFGRATRFAWRLSALFHRALPILREASEWTVKVVVCMKRREMPCILTGGSLPELAADVEPEERVIPMFDSRVERRFYSVMSSVSRCRVEREAEPIIVGDTLLVPDYVFERPDGVKWYLEIIGFWRPEYTAKKRAKLQELRKAGFEKLVLLVDHDYVGHFRDIGFPAFTYRMRGERLEAPYGAILNLMLS